MLEMSKLKYLAFLLSSIIFIGCSDKQDLINSEKYFKQEIEAYNDIFPEIINASSWTDNEPDSVFTLFFVFDSLKKVMNSDRQFLTGKFEKRQIQNRDLDEIPKIRLRLVTHFPKQKRIQERMDSTSKNNVSIRYNEKYTGKWLILSRICFDETFTKGFLTDSIWTQSYSKTDRIEIQKRNDKWEVREMIKGITY